MASVLSGMQSRAPDAWWAVETGGPESSERATSLRFLHNTPVFEDALNYKD